MLLARWRCLVAVESTSGKERHSRLALRSADTTLDNHELLLELDAIVAYELNLLYLKSLVLFVIVGDRRHVRAAVGARALWAESHLVWLLRPAAGERERLFGVSSHSHLVVLDLADRKLAATS